MANTVDILINATDKASQQVKKVSSSFDKLKSSAEKASTLITGVLGSAGVAIGAFVASGVKMNAELETSFSKWKTLTGSVKGANKQLDFIQKYAKQSPFDFKGVDETATALVGMGMSIKDTNKWIPTLGDMASVLGGGTEQINGVGIALGQMNAKGKVSAEEMMQLSERGINAWGMLADGMGLSVAEVQDLSSKGKILAKDALPLIYKGMQKAFGGGTAEYMKTTKGQFENLKESASQFAGQLTNPAYEWLGKVVLPLLNSALDDLQNKFSGGLLSGFQNLFNSKWAVPVTLLAGVITGALIGALVLIAPAIASAVVAFAPFLAIGVAVAGVVALIIANWGKLAPFFTQIFNMIKPVVEGFKTSFVSAFQQMLAGFQPAWESIKSGLSSLKPLIIAVVAIIGAQFAIAVAVFNGVVSAVGWIVSAFMNLVSVVVNVVMAIVALLQGDLSGAQKYWEKATRSSIEMVKNLWNALKGFLSGIWNTIVSILKAFGVNVNSSIKSMWTKVKTATVNGVTNMVTAVKNLPSKFASVVSNLSSKFASGVSKMFTTAVGKVKSGVSNMVSAIKGWGSKFFSSGTALLGEFAKGVANGVKKAVDAVSSGMKKIRSFLPFSPAKKGALSDLDKSGKAFFPTWYNGALTQVPKMTRAIGGAMGAVNNSLQSDFGAVGLDFFNGGTSTIRVVHQHEGTIEVEGDSGKETLDMTAQQIRNQTETDVFGGLRQTIRKK